MAVKDHFSKLVLATLLIMVLGACGGGGGTGTTGLTTTVTSADGLLTVEIPAGASDQADVTVRALDPGELPEEFSKLDLPVPVYELGPDGAEFSEPVRLTFRIPNAARKGRLPVHVLGITDQSGEWGVLSDQQIAFEGDSVVVSGTTTHFSTATAFDGGVILEMTPDAATAEVGKGFGVAVEEVGRALGSHGQYEPESIDGVPDNPQILSALAPRGALVVRFTCESAGRTSFEVRLTLNADFEDLFLLVPTFPHKEHDPIVSSVVFPGTAECLEKQTPTREVLARFNGVVAEFSGGDSSPEDFTGVYDVRIIAQPDGTVESVFAQRGTGDVLKGKVNNTGVPPVLTNPGKEKLTGGRMQNDRTLIYGPYTSDYGTWARVVFRFPAGALPFPGSD